MTDEQHAEVMDKLERMRWGLFLFIGGVWFILLYSICSTSGLQWLRELGGAFFIVGSMLFMSAMFILGARDRRFGARDGS